MAADVRWDEVLSALKAQGWHARAVPANREPDLRAAVNEALAGDDVPEGLRHSLRNYLHFAFPAEMPVPRSMIVAAVARPLTRASLLWRGEQHIVCIPPHYMGYERATPCFTDAVGAALHSYGYSAAPFKAPFKTLAVRSGLARYGRNNIAYVDGLGSYLALAACVSDAPVAEDPWGEPVALERCDACQACRRGCPTGAVGDDRFLLHAERCLTYFNEDEAPFPDWIRAEWHTCAVGCLRCQQACPENARVELLVEPAVEFDASETELILAGADPEELDQATRRKMERCGLDYNGTFMPRNIRLLLGAD